MSVLATALVTFFGRNASRYATDRFHHGWTTIPYAAPISSPPPRYVPNADDWANTYHRLRLFNGTMILPPPSPLYLSILQSQESPPLTAATDNVPRFPPPPEWRNIVWRVLYDVLVITLHQYVSIARISWERRTIRDEAAKVVLEFKRQLTGMALKLKAAYVEISRLREIELSSRKSLRKEYEERLEHERIEIRKEYASEADQFKGKEQMRSKAEVTAITSKHDEEMKRVLQKQAETEAKVHDIRAVESKLFKSERKCRALDAESREKSLVIDKKDASLKRKTDRRADAENLCNQRIAEMRNELEKQKISSGESDELRTKVHDLKLEIDALKKEKDMMKAKYELEAVQAAKTARDVQAYEVKQAKAKVSVLQKEVSDLERKVSASEGNVSRLETEKIIGTDFYECLQKELQTAKKGREADLKEYKLLKEAQDAQTQKHQANSQEQAAEIQNLQKHVDNFIELIGNHGAFTGKVASNASSKEVLPAALEAKVDPVFAASPAIVMALKDATKSSKSGPVDVPAATPMDEPEPSAFNSDQVSTAVAPQAESEPSKSKAVGLSTITTEDAPKLSTNTVLDHVAAIVHEDEPKPSSPATKPSAAVARKIEAPTSSFQAMRSAVTKASKFKSNANSRAKRPFGTTALHMIEKEVKKAAFDTIIPKPEDVQKQAAQDAQASASKAVFHAEDQQIQGGQEHLAKESAPVNPGAGEPDQRQHIEADNTQEVQEAPVVQEMPDVPEVAELQEAPVVVQEMPDVPEVAKMQEAPEMETNSALPTLADILEQLKLSASVPSPEPFATQNDAGTNVDMFPEFNQYQWEEAMEGLENDVEEDSEKITGFEDFAQYDVMDHLQVMEDRGELLPFNMIGLGDLPELPPLDMSDQSSAFAGVPQSSLPKAEIQQMNPSKKLRFDTPPKAVLQEPDYQSIPWEASTVSQGPSPTESEYDFEMGQSPGDAESKADLEMTQSPGDAESEQDLEMAQSPGDAKSETDLEMAQSPADAKSETDLEMAQPPGDAESEKESGVRSGEASASPEASSSEGSVDEASRKPSPFSPFSRVTSPVPSPSVAPGSSTTGSYYASRSPSHTLDTRSYGPPLLPGLRVHGTSYSPANSPRPSSSAPPYVPATTSGPSTTAPPYIPSYRRGPSTSALPPHNPAVLPPTGIPYGPSTHPVPWGPVTNPSPQIHGSIYKAFDFSSPTSLSQTLPPRQTTTPPQAKSWLGVPRMSPAEPQPQQELEEKPKRFPPPGSRQTLNPRVPNLTPGAPQPIVQQPLGQPSLPSSSDGSPLSSAPPSPPPPPSNPALIIDPVDNREKYLIRGAQKGKGTSGLFANLKKPTEDST